MSNNGDIEFPDKLCRAIAEITDKFSFAYMQEAFVAALLAIARKSESNASVTEERRRLVEKPANKTNIVQLEMDDGWTGVHALVHGLSEDSGLDKLPLWVEIKKQIEILRQGMDEEKGITGLGQRIPQASMSVGCTFTASKA